LKNIITNAPPKAKMNRTTRTANQTADGDENGEENQDNAIFSLGVANTGQEKSVDKRQSKLSQPKVKQPPGTDFTTSYYPSGQPYKTETLDKRKLEVHHVDNW
jgi:hypothetical protein